MTKWKKFISVLLYLVWPLSPQPALLQGNEARHFLSILHDPHDLVEENPIGQSHVMLSGTLGN